jgi:hypothetical protein
MRNGRRRAQRWISPGPWGSLGCLILMGFCLPGPGRSQERTLVLEARFSQVFQTVGGIRPLSDGRIMVADPSAGALTVIDFESGSSNPLRAGDAGRREYRTPYTLLSLPGDSTLVVDLGTGRLTVVDSTGTPGRTMPIAREVEGGHLAIVLPRFADGQGRIYYPREIITGGTVRDSTPIVRFDPSTVSEWEVASVGLPARARPRGGSISLGRRPLAPGDDWAVDSDGRLALVRADGYRVEWVGTDGSVSRGPGNPLETAAPGQPEKESWFGDFLTKQVSTGIRRTSDGRRQVTLRVGSSSALPADLDAYDWPERLPPFRVGRSLVAPDGKLWVQRYSRVGAPSLVDVFDGSGRRVGGVLLPPDRRVVGFGQGVVYLAHQDGRIGEWIERYHISA